MRDLELKLGAEAEAIPGFLLWQVSKLWQRHLTLAVQADAAERPRRQVSDRPESRGHSLFDDQRERPIRVQQVSAMARDAPFGQRRAERVLAGIVEQRRRRGLHERDDGPHARRGLRLRGYH